MYLCADTVREKDAACDEAGWRNVRERKGESMLIEIDFNSPEAIYIQLRNQIVMEIAQDRLHDGDSLPSVRSLARDLGVNMHTVNKAYAVLRQEGLIRLDRRTGAVIALNIDRLKAMEEMKAQLRLAIARGLCKGISREEIHALVDEIFSEYL